jgi:hypothetical protein
MTKQTVRLERWTFVKGRLQGYVYGHPRFADGEFVTTSTVMSAPDSVKDGNTIQTKNTEYQLSNKYKEN